MPTSFVNLSHPTVGSQLRVMWAIATKDWKMYWRYPLNSLSIVFQPLIWLTPVYFMGQAFSVNGQARGFAAYSGTTDYMSFILLGTALSNFISAVFWGIGYLLKNDMDMGVLESTWMAPISRPLMMVARTLTNLTITALTSVVMLLVAALIFGFRPTGNALATVLTVLPMLIGLYGFGFAFASLILIMREANTMVDVSSFLIQTFSGANFPVKALPGWLLPVALVLPLTYGFDAARGFLLKTQTILPINTEVLILIAFMFIFVALGMAVFRVLERSVRQRGTLGQH